MLRLLEEIKTSPGVMGACIFTTQKGIIASNLPAIFKEEAQKRIGNILQRIFKLNEAVKLDVNAFEIQYDEALILVKKLCGTASLILICEPDANIHLINMSTSVLADDLQKLATVCVKEPEQNAPAPQAPTAPEDPKEVLNGALAPEFAKIKSALAKHIGPIAKKMLEKHMATWLQQGPSSKGRLKELIQLLITEIDSETDQKDFINQLQNSL